MKKRMIKKILVILSVMIFAFAITACGGNDSTATVTDKEGNTVTMTSKELSEIYKENQAKFDKLYTGADIVVEGKVKTISAGLRKNGGSILIDEVELEGNWDACFLAGWYDDELAELNKGDKVRITSKISSGFGSSVEIRGVSSSGSYDRKTMSEAKLEVIEE